MASCVSSSFTGVRRGPRPRASHSVTAGSQVEISPASFKGKGCFTTEMLFSPTRCDVSVSGGEHPQTKMQKCNRHICPLQPRVHGSRGEESQEHLAPRAARTLTAPEPTPAPVTESLPTLTVPRFGPAPASAVGRTRRPASRPRAVTAEWQHSEDREGRGTRPGDVSRVPLRGSAAR